MRAANTLPLVVFFSGTHGVGKTTTLKDVHNQFEQSDDLKKYKVTTVCEVSRALRGRYGFENNDMAQDVDQLAILSSYYAQLATHIQDPDTDVVLLDRSPYDMLAYTLLNPNISQRVKDYCTNLTSDFCSTANPQCSMLLHFPLIPEHIPLRADEVRLDNPAYQEAVSNLLISLRGMIAFKGSSFFVTSPNREHRATQLISLITSKLL